MLIQTLDGYVLSEQIEGPFRVPLERERSSLGIASVYDFFVASHKQGGLIVVRRETLEGLAATTVPAQPGWLAHYVDEKDRRPYFREPIIAWQISSINCTPCTCEGPLDDMSEYWIEAPDGTVRIIGDQAASSMEELIADIKKDEEERAAAKR